VLTAAELQKYVRLWGMSIQATVTIWVSCYL